MAEYYVYLISSLPMLHFGARPPFAFKKLLEACRGIISDEDIDLLKTSSMTGEYNYRGAQPTLRAWQAFDTALRNELIKIRSHRKKTDPAKYLRRDDEYFDTSISHIAMASHRNPSALESERMLDQERWRILEELSSGHYFDIDFLIVYAHKLLILQRWDAIRTLDKSEALQDMLRRN